MSAAPLRVALLNFAFWPEVRRGSERLLHDLALELIDLGHRPRLITSHPGPPKRSVEEGLEIVRNWRPPRRLLRLRKIEPNLTHLPFTYASLRRGRDDVAHAFFATDALAAVRWSRETGRPSIFTYTGIPQRNVTSTLRLRLRILEQATRESSAVTVVSRAARDAMWRWLGVEARLIYPGVRLAEFTPGDARDPHPTIACAAELDDARKRIDLLLAAFSRVRREHPQAKLLLQRPSTKELSRRLRTGTDGIEFFAPDAVGIRSAFRRAWATALTSYNEAFGLVVVESLACGTPAVASRDGGTAEILDRPGIGALFEGDDPAAVARHLLDALELGRDPATAARCRARAENFSTVTTARAHEALYREWLDT